MHVITLIQTEGRDARGLPHWLFHSSVRWENNPILRKKSRAAGSKAAWLHAVSGGMERASTADSYFTLQSIQKITTNVRDNTCTFVHMCRQAPCAEHTIHSFLNQRKMQNTCLVYARFLLFWGLGAGSRILCQVYPLLLTLSIAPGTLLQLGSHTLQEQFGGWGDEVLPYKHVHQSSESQHSHRNVQAWEQSGTPALGTKTGRISWQGGQQD